MSAPLDPKVQSQVQSIRQQLNDLDPKQSTSFLEKEIKNLLGEKNIPENVKQNLSRAMKDLQIGKMADAKNEIDAILGPVSGLTKDAEDFSKLLNQLIEAYQKNDTKKAETILKNMKEIPIKKLPQNLLQPMEQVFEVARTSNEPVPRLQTLQKDINNEIKKSQPSPLEIKSAKGELG